MKISIPPRKSSRIASHLTWEDSKNGNSGHVSHGYIPLVRHCQDRCAVLEVDEVLIVTEETGCLSVAADCRQTGERLCEMSIEK